MSRKEPLEQVELGPTERELEIIEEIRKFEMRSPWQVQESKRHADIVEGYITHILDVQPNRPDGAKVAELHGEGTSVALWRRFDSPSISFIKRDWQYPNTETMYELKQYRVRQHEQVDPIAALTGYEVTKYSKELASSEYVVEKSNLGELAQELESYFGSSLAADETA